MVFCAFTDYSSQLNSLKGALVKYQSLLVAHESSFRKL